MKTVKNLLLALVAVVMMACTFSATAAEAAPTAASVAAKASKSLKDMSLEELLAFLRTLTPEEVAALMGEVVSTGDVALIDTFGKAFSTLVASADPESRDQLLSSAYAANPGMVIDNTGAIFATGALGNPASMMFNGPMAAFTAGNNTSTANTAIIDADVEVPQPHEYSAGATR